MTKKEIVRQISERANLTQLRTKEIVQWTFDAIIETLVEEGRIELRNFGVFEVKVRKARTARNPRTNEEVIVEEKNVVTFQPGKVMEEKVRRVPVKPPAKKKTRTKSSAKVGSNGYALPENIDADADLDTFDQDTLPDVLPMKPR